MKFKVEYGRHGIGGEIRVANDTIESDIDLSKIDGIVKVGTVIKDVINIAPETIRKKSRRK